MVWGGWGDAEKLYASMCVEFLLFGREKKSGKPPKTFFEFLTLVIRHRFLFFVPETLNPIFLGKSKKTRAGKVNLEPYDAIWCQFGSQFSSPKTQHSS